MSESRRLRVPDSLVEQVRKLHPDLKRKVRAALDDLVADPSIGKGLRDDLEGLRSLRVGRLRIIYRESGSMIDLIAVGPRTTIYEETSRLIAREPGPKPRRKG